ncbi:hypothetical protein Tco_1492507 [Tanacetum coccineum]
MLASMLSPIDLICSGSGGTDGGSDGESGLDLLRDEDGNSDESSGCRTRLAGRDWVASVQSGDGGTGLMDKVVISLSESDMMTKGVNSPARGVVAERKRNGAVTIQGFMSLVRKAQDAALVKGAAFLKICGYFFQELIFTFPCELMTSPKVPSNFDNVNMALF